MDPVTMGAVLVAVVTGVSEVLGGQLWSGVVSLVRRPLNGRKNAAGETVVKSGEAELLALQESGGDQQIAVALAEVLLTRANASAGFELALRDWWRQASPIREKLGDVTNTISGGNQYGPVLQGRDFTNLTFGEASPAAPPKDSGAGLVTGERAGKTSNTVSGGNFHGPSFIGRDFINPVFVTSQAAARPMAGSISAKIFVSYRRADTNWPARWLADRLTKEFGAGVVFQDMESIQPGDDYAAEIEAAVGGCSVLLVLIGPRWLIADGQTGQRLDNPQDWVRLEIEAAIRHGVRIIPVLVDDAQMPIARELPLSLQWLARTQAATLSSTSLGTRELVSALEILLAREERTAAQPEPQTLESALHPQSRISRLLTSAVHAALMLTGTEKTDALTVITRTAAVAAPERAGWLASEAEAAACLIEDASLGWPALAEVAEAMAMIDPQRAEAIASSIEDAPVRWSALAGVAGILATTDLEWARAIARSIKDESWRGSALARMAEVVAVADPWQAYDIACSIEKRGRPQSVIATSI